MTSGKSCPKGGRRSSTRGIRTVYGPYIADSSPRCKVIHTQGVVCQFNLDVAPGLPWTGLFSEGNQEGLIRLGAANSLDEWSFLRKVFPGMGIKFLRTGRKSANFVALRETGPGGSENYFASTISNHVAPPSALLKLGKFQEASGCVSMVGLSDVASYGQDGQKAASPEFPFELAFEPTSAAKATQDDQAKSNDGMLKALSSIPSGTTLFEVYSYASPADKKAGKKAYLGKLTTTSECVESTFGDEHMFFRHVRMEEDFKLKPEWIPQMPALQDPGCLKPTTGPISKWQCPASN